MTTVKRFTVYQLLQQLPKATATETYLPLDRLECTAYELRAALQRHGFTVEQVTTHTLPYLKITREDGVEFGIDFCPCGFNFYDGADVETKTMHEVRTLPYDVPEGFWNLSWARAAKSGEVLPRYTSGWPLLESEGPEDAHPGVKLARAEKAEKERIAGVDEENKKLREELQGVYHLIMTDKTPTQRLVLMTAKTCCGQAPILDTWDENEARSVTCPGCGKRTKSHFCRADAIAEWDTLA